MKASIFTTIVIIISSLNLGAAVDPITKIAKANKAREEAKQAYINKNYKEAIGHYSLLLDSLNVEDAAAALNRANAYYHTKDTIQALDAYRSLTNEENASIRSKAFMQLGVISEESSEFETALNYYKEAIKADYKNEKARYNYELLKKKLKDQEKNQGKQDQENQDQNKDQDQKKDQQKQNQDSKNQENQQNQDQEQEGDDQKQNQQQKDQQQKGEQKDSQKQEGDQQKKDSEKQNGEEEQQKQADEKQEGKDGEKAKKEPISQSLKEKLKQMNMSQEKAEMILQALQNNEAQYFQQLRKKASEYPDSKKPDW